MQTGPVYFDYAATTPVDPEVAQAMAQCLTRPGEGNMGNYANPASRSHRLGWQAEEAVENARSQLAEFIAADPREIVWTSGATESDNLALKGVLESRGYENSHVLTSSIEHKAVLDSCQYLESRGASVSYLQPNAQGLISPDAVLDAVREDTVLVSLMMVNNEIGVINDISAVGEKIKQRNIRRAKGNKILFHVDAAQAAGKLNIDVNAQHIDLLSLSAHKMYGPKGMGALFVRRSPEVKLSAQIHGGGHERGMRSGTLATHQIVGFAKAVELAMENFQEENKRILGLRKRFLSGLKKLSEVQVNGCLENRVANNLNLAFAGVDGESLLVALKDLAVSSGSACTSTSVDPSYVLKAIGLSDELAHASLRFSLGRYTTENEIDFAVEKITSVLYNLRKGSAA